MTRGSASTLRLAALLRGFGSSVPGDAREDQPADISRSGRSKTKGDVLEPEAAGENIVDQRERGPLDLVRTRVQVSAAALARLSSRPLSAERDVSTSLTERCSPSGLSWKAHNGASVERRAAGYAVRTASTARTAQH